MMTDNMGGDPKESPDENQDMTPESAEVPTAFFGDKQPKEGDVYSFKVISVDSDNGMATVQYVSSEPDSDDKGIDGMMSAAQPEAQ